jgi:hypothetical protein
MVNVLSCTAFFNFEDVFEKDFKRLQLISGYYYLYS